MKTTVTKLVLGLALLAACWLCHPDRSYGSGQHMLDDRNTPGWSWAESAALDPPAAPRDGWEALGALEVIGRRQNEQVPEGVARALEADPSTRELGRILLRPGGRVEVLGGTWQPPPPESDLGRLVAYLHRWQGGHLPPTAEELELIEGMDPRALLAADMRRVAALADYLEARGVSLVHRMRALGSGNAWESWVSRCHGVVTWAVSWAGVAGLPPMHDRARLDELDLQLSELESSLSWLTPRRWWGRPWPGPSVLEDFEPIQTQHERLELALALAGRLLPAALVMILALALLSRRNGVAVSPHGVLWHWLPPALGAAVLVLASLAPGKHGDGRVFSFLLPAGLLLVIGVATWVRGAGGARWEERGARRWQVGGVVLVLLLTTIAATLWSRGGGSAWRQTDWRGYGFIVEAAILWVVMCGLAAVVLVRGVASPAGELRGRVTRVILAAVVLLTLAAGAIGVRAVIDSEPRPREAALIFLAALVAGMLMTRIGFLRRLGASRPHVPLGMVLAGGTVIALWILDPRDTQESGELLVCSMDVALLLLGTLWLGSFLRVAARPPVREDPAAGDRAHALLAGLADGLLVVVVLSCLYAYQLNAAHWKVEQALAALAPR